MPYEDYQVYDFVVDPFFRRWVLAPDEDICAFWDLWEQNHPDSQEILQHARKLVVLTHFEDVEVKGSAESKTKIKAQLFGQQNPPKAEPATIFPHFRRHYHIAAVISALIVLGVYLTYHLWEQTQVYTTAYGQIMEVSLPDGSSAILNANSSLIIGKAWDAKREVWLRGEAFFNIDKYPAGTQGDKHGRAYRKFTVHAGEVDIEVLGTRFNVQQRCHSTQVTLEEGLVKLKEKQKAAIPVKMNAGESVSFSDKDRVFKKEIVDTRTALSWKDGMHIFDATPLHVIAELLEDTYGYEVKFKSKALKKKRFSAQVPYGEVDLMMVLLQESLEVEIVRQEGTIMIK